VRQALAESLVLGVAGGLVAAVLTSWTAESLALFIPPSSVPVVLNGRIDGRLLAATIALVTSAACGVLPALRASGLDPAAALKEEAGSVSGSLRRARVLTSLVVAQVALSAVLLVCSGLLVRSLRNAERSDPGFDPRGVALASIDPPAAGYGRAASHELQRRLVRALSAVPGVTSVSLADWVPLTFSGQSERLTPEGYVPRPHESMDVRSAYVGPSYMATMKATLIDGRDLTDDDADGAPKVCVVNRAFVDRYWPGERAVGRRLQRGKDWLEVVGVARTMKHLRLSEVDEPMVWLPLLQGDRGDLTVHVRTSGDPSQLLTVVQKTLRATDPKLPIYDVSTLERSIRIGSLFERLAGTFVGSFGLVALALASVGMYGVLAYSTRQRTREIGIRLALGARPAQVFALVLRQAGLLSGLGLGLGLLVAAATTRFLRSMLVGVEETDVATFATVAVMLAIVSLAACVVPALRAARVRPLQALRHE
jgi:predicted permease